MSILIRQHALDYSYVFSPSGTSLMGKLRILRVDDTYNTHHGNASTHLHIYSLCATQIRIELNQQVYDSVVGSYTGTTTRTNVTLIKTDVSLKSGYNKIYVKTL